MLQDIYLDGVRYDGSLLEEVCNLINEKGLRLRLPLEELQVLSEPLPQSEDEDHAAVKSEPLDEELDDSSSSEDSTPQIGDKEQVHPKQNEIPLEGGAEDECHMVYKQNQNADTFMSMMEMKVQQGAISSDEQNAESEQKT